MQNTPLIISQSDLNLHEFTELVKDWEIDFIQLGGGSFLCSLDQILFPEFQLSSLCFNSRVKQEGRSPKGYWTFTFANTENGLFWRNYKVEPQSLIIYAPGSEINGVSSAHFEPFLFSVHEDILMALIKKTNAPEVLSLLKNEILVSDSPLWNELKNQIKTGIADYKTKPNYEGKPHFLRDFLYALLELIKTAKPSVKKVSSKSRLQLLVDAERFIQQHLHEQVSVLDIANHCQVSERTLLYTFKKRFGIGPKAYTKILKLNHVYRVLQKAPNSQTIANIAREYGFWHMGQFHADYKDFFGELPSESLSKIKGK